MMHRSTFSPARGASRSASRSPWSRGAQSVRAGFTLVEILVVLVIIAILAAILLPVLSSARERGYQANCAANLQQIGLATKLYYTDEKRYPASIALLLPPSQPTDLATGQSVLDNTDVPAPANGINGVAGSCGKNSANDEVCANIGGGDYLKTAGLPVCPDDDYNGTKPHSSYGDVSTGRNKTAAVALAGTTPGIEISRYTWNYFGYNAQGYAYTSPADAASDPALPKLLKTPVTTTTPAFDAAAWATDAGDPNYGSYLTNPVASSLSNRYAPGTTIITRCVYHRLPTGKNINSPELLYPKADGTYDPAGTAPTADSAAAIDLVLRLDNSLTRPQVGTFQAPADGTSNWQTQNFR